VRLALAMLGAAAVADGVLIVMMWFARRSVMKLRFKAAASLNQMHAQILRAALAMRLRYGVETSEVLDDLIIRLQKDTARLRKPAAAETKHPDHLPLAPSE